MRIATAKMEGIVSKARDQVEQRQWLWTAVISVVMGGVMLGVVLAALLPWGVGRGAWANGWRRCRLPLGIDGLRGRRF